MYVVITPVRNEARCLPGTIDSMVAQTHRPSQWVIVDDGSSDGTGEIVDTAARSHPWITPVRRRDRGFRKPGGGVVEAFYDGYSALDRPEWEFVAKLDGDLTFGPHYFERSLAHFAADHLLGIGGGTIYVAERGRLQVDSPGDPPFHVRGATKIYRRACWEHVHPLLKGPGWDTIDEVRANMHGWSTRTFSDVQLMQRRGTGAVDGSWANCYKNGLANYATGYHPAFMLAKCFKRVWMKPRVVAGAALFVGFCSGYWRREPRMTDVSTVKYLRKQQIRYLTLQPSIYRPAPSRRPE